MRNTQSPVASLRRDSGQSTPADRPTSTFPHFPSDHTPLLVRPHVHSSRGHLSWPGNLLQVTQQALIHPQSEQSMPFSAQISALRTGRTQSPDAQWGTQIGISWGILNILEPWTNTSYLKGKSLVRGYKTWVCKGLMNETWSLGWAPFRGEEHPPTLFFFPCLTKV